jgi:hypothetical protein
MMSRTHFLRSALSTLGRTTTVGGGAARSPCLTPLTPALRFLADDSEIKAATLKRDRDMGSIWILQDAELEAIWDKAHDKSEAHSTPFVVEEVVRLTINKQREKLSAAIEAKEAKEAKLKGAEDLGMLSSLLRWKRWGLAIEIEDCADELEAARLLLKHLHATDETVSYIMEAMGAEEGSVEGSVSKETFLGAVRGGVMEQEEIATFIESLDELEPKK